MEGLLGVENIAMMLFLPCVDDEMTFCLSVDIPVELDEKKCTLVAVDVHTNIQ
jgi:hypothetical protein